VLFDGAVNINIIFLLILADTNNYTCGKQSTPNKKERKMAKDMKSGKKPVTKPATKPATPKKLSKAGKWLEAHPNGIGKILDMRAVMK
jgi:hypothetical protein